MDISTIISGSYSILAIALVVSSRGKTACESAYLFWVIEEDDTMTRFGSRMTAWQDDECQQLLAECGFQKPRRIATSAWPTSDTLAGKFYTLLAHIKR